MKNYSKIILFLLIICVFGADGGEVSVMEGDSVTLDIDFRELFDLITWRFGDSYSIIAESNGYKISYPDERFRDRLKQNHQTGSLTINNMRITDSGDYKLEIKQWDLLKIFSVTVHVFGADGDGVKRESVMEGDSVTLDTRLREKFNRIKWRFGVSGSVIAQIDSNEISYPLNDTERFRDRLKMNNQTGSLIIKNMRITDSGLYEIEFDQDSWEPYEKYDVFICRSYQYPDPDSYPELSPGEVAAIAVVVLMVLSVVIYCCKSSKQGRQNRESVTDAEKQKNTDSGDYKLQIEPCSEGSTGKNANELETSEIPLLSKEDPDRARVQPTT